MLNRSRRFLIPTIVLLTLMLGAIPALAATLTGVVTDHTDGQPLLGATITARPADPALEVLGTSSVNDGTFELELQPIVYDITVSFVGYTSTHFTIEVPSTESATLSAALIPKAIDLNTISVTASRRPEKTNDAPASVSVVEAEAIAERTALTVTDHVKGLPGVDMARTGLNQTNMVTRGFNNIFSGALLVLTDNRMARVPSLRFNAYNFIPTVGDDIERIEIVSGPGSALYGPNSAAGVMHIVTKSPFGSEGTTVSVGGGERDLMLGSFRHAGTVNNRIGYKFSGQYYTGHDWEHTEPIEPDSIVKYRPTATGPEPVGEKVANARDNDLEKLAGEGRVDFLINENTSLILNGGYNRNSGIELTGLGAGQAIDWSYSYGQARLKYKDLFVQGFVNMSDAGDTYLLNTGQLIVDKSRVWSTQVQHSYRANEKWLFTYGADAIMTRPNTEATINGSNEQSDNIDEFGGYVQFENQLTEKLKLVGAARVDDHSELEDLNFSPRAALVFQPTDRGTLRFTYNRAFATPDNNNLFLDILSVRDPFGLQTNFAPSLPFDMSSMDIGVAGVPRSGWHWRRGDEGPDFRSPFAPLIGQDSTSFIPYNNPAFVNAAWGLGRGAVMSGLQTTLEGAGLSAAQIAGIMGAVDNATPAMVSGVNNTLMTFNPDTKSFDRSSVDDIVDIERLKPSITQTFELGYKGMLGERLRFSVDAYRTQKHDFIGPLTVESPNVFLDPTTLSGHLATEIGTWYATQATMGDSVALGSLDAAAFGGNGDGTPVDELVTMFTSGAARIPFGTVTPEESADPTSVLVTYRNFGDITYYGADFSFAYHLNRNWDFGGSYSYISQNFFSKEEDESLARDIHLNAPRNKAGLFVQYNQPKRNLAVGLRGRYVDAFDMDSPFYGSRVESYVIADLNVGIDIMADLRFTATVQNMFDDKHVEFIGAPAIGRLATARLTQRF